MQPTGKALEGWRVYIASAHDVGSGALGTVKLFEPMTSSYLVETDTGETLWCRIDQIKVLKVGKR